MNHTRAHLVAAHWVGGVNMTEWVSQSMTYRLPRREIRVAACRGHSGRHLAPRSTAVGQAMCTQGRPKWVWTASTLDSLELGLSDTPLPLPLPYSNSTHLNLSSRCRK